MTSENSVLLVAYVNSNTKSKKNNAYYKNDEIQTKAVKNCDVPLINKSSLGQKECLEISYVIHRKSLKSYRQNIAVIIFVSLFLTPFSVYFLFGKSETKNVWPTFTENLFSNEKQNIFDSSRELLIEGKTPNYQIGVARADITGPAADVVMMGYANPDQITGGIHLRQFARSFIIGQNTSRFVFVNLDSCMSTTLIKLEVLKKLKKRFGGLYNKENVCISATHTHSGPAGYSQYVLFQVPSKGYVLETINAMVDGIVEFIDVSLPNYRGASSEKAKSIEKAHNNYADGFILMNKGELLDSNINRSPTAYLNNPEEERIRYKYNVDKEMILLKFLNANGKGIGMLNWFPVHCTSMNNTNTLISSDNKGYAELLFEHEMDPGSLFGKSRFVAAFAQSNEGDVSPNTRGPHCLDTDLPCDNIHSTCGGIAEKCVARGPGKDMFESTKIIGQRQFLKAMELYKKTVTFVKGPMQFVQQYVNMTKADLVLNSTHTVRTCKPAKGFSFAAGTADGQGRFDFKQGDIKENAFWKLVRSFINPPTEEEVNCHFPKPLLETDTLHFPYPWQPDIVETQILRLGQFIVIAVPGEFTTMSGRRLRNAVLQIMKKKQPKISWEGVIAGLSNTYSDYIATIEEYQIQRYEGASTIYGPYTLSVYIEQYKKLANFLMQERKPNNSIVPHNYLKDLISFVPVVFMDEPHTGRSFGDVLTQVHRFYTLGDVVSVKFVAANPRNSPTKNMTFLTVQKKIDNSSWKVMKTDADFDTKFIWKRISILSSTSEVTIEWEIPPTTSPGQYQITHFGHYKYFWNRKIYAYSGRSNIFYIQ